MPRRPSTTAAQKLKVLEKHGGHAYCAACGFPFALHFIEYDHVHPLALGGEHTVENLRPVCKTCHKAKTSGTGATTHGSDIGNISKTRRLEKARKAQEDGEKKAKKMKPKIQSRGFDKRFKKKMNGKVEVRE